MIFTHKHIKTLVQKEKKERYYNYLCKKGVTLGKDILFVDPKSISIDLTRPYMVSIGDFCTIGKNTAILTHDFSWGVLKKMNGDIVGNCKPVILENNVFIGWNVVILPGATIGENSVIGAGSIVTKTIPKNEVWAGNPARKICSIDELYKKEKQQFLNDAYLLFHFYYSKYNVIPTAKEFHEFFFLFLEYTDKNYKISWVFKQINVKGSPDLAINFWKSYVRPFVNFNDFIEYCLKKEIKEN